MKIYERPAELAAYRQARIHVFLLPGEAIVTSCVHLIEVNLTDMCTFASSRQPGTWRLTKERPSAP